MSVLVGKTVRKWVGNDPEFGRGAFVGLTVGTVSLQALVFSNGKLKD